ncbi:MAG: hypothetical protein ABMB14_19200 [Myxococcota bacterium]
MIGWLLAGCPHPPAPVPVEPTAPEVPVAERSPITGPAYWSEPGGLCLEVPAGWTGSTGASPDLLTLVQDRTGFGFEIRGWPVAEPTPPRPGWTVSWEDTGAWRTVPILATATGTRTWQSDEGDGRAIQSWYGPLGDRTVEIAAVYPPGRTIEGRDVIEPLLHALCTTWRSEGPPRPE